MIRRNQRFVWKWDYNFWYSYYVYNLGWSHERAMAEVEKDQAEWVRKTRIAGVTPGRYIYREKDWDYEHLWRRSRDDRKIFITETQEYNPCSVKCRQRPSFY